MSKLAIKGGVPVLSSSEKHPFASTTESDIREVLNCFKNNSFSAFRAGDYDGGNYVQKFEQSIKDTFGCDYATSFDTWSNMALANTAPFANFEILETWAFVEIPKPTSTGRSE